MATVQKDFYKQTKPKKGEFNPTKLKGFGDRILQLSQSLEYVRAIDSLDEAANLQDFSTERLGDEIGVFAKPSFQSLHYHQVPPFKVYTITKSPPFKVHTITKSPPFKGGLGGIKPKEK